ncbi:MAG: hypothetical protein R3304_07270, partial [Longimicrobiales bacterium]|nr:hypothetical protein [Longimicrobiales bacterium]
GQFYNVSYGMEVPYTVCGGLQDNYTWCGPSRKAEEDITNHDWFRVSGGDGFVSQQDPRHPELVYSESQGGNMGRSNLDTGERTSFERPDWRNVYREYQDSIALLWPDITEPMPEEQRERMEDLQERATTDSLALQLRYNWNTPFFLSPHDPDVVYAGANRVLKSDWRGDDMYTISPDLTRADPEKIEISTETTGGITPDVTGAEVFATITSLAESPIEEGLLYAGTDDGNLWASPDGGGAWVELTEATEGLIPDGTYVSRIEPSKHERDRVYVSFDNHRRGDFTPYVLVSENGGRSFRSIASDLPTGKPDFVHVIREDHVNPDLLFVGTDVGVYVSVDRGASWRRFMSNLPTVPVRDLQIHPRDGEIIAGTHGRSIWIADIKPLQQYSSVVAEAGAYLFEPAPAFHYGGSSTGGEFTAQHYFVAYNPEYGAEFKYWLGTDPDEDVQIAVEDDDGEELWSTEGANRRGIHSAVWNLRGRTVQLERSPSEIRDSLRIERRLEEVADSLVEAGEAHEDVDEAVASLRDPGEGGGGRFGGRDDEGLPFDADGNFVERPAEGPVVGEGGGFGGDDSLEDRIRDLVTGEEGGRGRWRRRGSIFPGRTEPAPRAEPGVYTVILKVGHEEYRQRFTLERTETAPDA